MTQSAEKRPPAKLWVRVLRCAALVVVGLYLLLFLMVLVSEDSFIYFPTKVPPEKNILTLHMDHPVEDIFLETSDGVRLHGWYVTAEDPLATILFLHGNGGNLFGRSSWANMIAKTPANVFIIDYRGYGKSEGEPSEEGLYLDAEAAHRWLTGERGIPPGRIVVYGSSLGGAPACELVLRRPCGGLILMSAFTSAGDMAQTMMPFFPGRWFIKSKFDNVGKIAKITIPKLIIHSRTDEMIPYWMGEKLHEVAPEPKTFLSFDRAGHNEVAGEKGAAIIDEFRKLLTAVRDAK